MPIQIIGTKKCRETQKALRFFRERGCDVQYRDLAVKPLSPGEIDNIARSVPWNVLIDENSREYRDNRLDRFLMEPREKLLKHPAILRTPVVRNGARAVAGDNPEAWSALGETN